MYKKYVKRLLDIILSLIAIIIASPIIIIISIMIYFFLGKPIIFKQKRPGYKGKIFTLYKFRTMTDKKDKNGDLLPDEKRLTKFGNFLRKTSIDEIPEFFNILKGDMSFIGPRPMLVRDLVFFDNNVKQRQNIIPGLTGLAQVNGRNAINWDKRFEYDLKYIENITFYNDLKIFFMTIIKVFKKEGIGEDNTDLSIDYGDYLLKNKRVTKKEYDKKQQEAKKILNEINPIITGNELVSIIMPSYNTGKFISQSIESILNQTYQNFEIIIVDDNSNDNTDEIVKKYDDKRIKYFKNKQNKGAAYSRNFALEKAEGELIAFLDSDDLWENNKLEKQINFMKEKQCYFSYTMYEEIDEENKTLGNIISGPKIVTAKKMYDYCWPGCLTVMYHKEKVGLIQIKNLKKNNDYAMWLKAINRTNCYLLEENLAKYRKRRNSLTNTNKIKLIKYHYQLFRKGEELGVLLSTIYTIKNLFFGIIKKIKYRRKK